SLRGRGHFYCDGKAELTVPAGTYRLTGYRGPEYRVAAKEIVVKAGQTHEGTVELQRWAHLAKDGWHSGELHMHANYGYGSWFNTPETMRQQCVGEDLNVCNFMVANSDADGHKSKTMTLTAEEFLRRFVQHVLPKGFVKMRHYGLLANRHREE